MQQAKSVPTRSDAMAMLVLAKTGARHIGWPPRTDLQFDVVSDGTADPSNFEDGKNSIGILSITADLYTWAFTHVDTDTLNDPSRIVEADIVINSTAKWPGTTTNVTWVYGPDTTGPSPRRTGPHSTPT